VSNLAPACHPCNQKKGAKTAAEFGHPEMEAQAKAPLRDAAAVNSTRWALYYRLHALGVSVETGSGGRTKWNRVQHGMPTTHWLDAVAVGASTPEQIRWQSVAPLQITALGRHNRQMMHVTERGFPTGKPKATSVVGGFRSGDLVRALVPKALKTAGVHVGTISIRATGFCDVTTTVRQLQRVDGYRYLVGSRALPPPSSDGRFRTLVL
jgi:hypothetical protein